jgi:serine O-acetyltransferase
MAHDPWNLGTIVAELRAARCRSTRDADRLRARESLPSREALVRIVDGLRAVLFPTHFGPADLGADGVDYFVGHTLDRTLQALEPQVRRGLDLADAAGSDADARALELTRAFAGQLPAVRSLLDTDIRAAFEGDPAAKSLDEVVFCYPGITAITHHRLAHALYGLGCEILARIIAEIAHAQTGIDIHPGATIDESFFIDHGTGVVIGETARLGKGVRLYQGVTLGAKSFPLDDDGAPIKGQPRHPIVEDAVVIYAGATILGRVTIGAGSTIGGNVWLTRSVPPNSRITQGLAQGQAPTPSGRLDDGAGI